MNQVKITITYHPSTQTSIVQKACINSRLFSSALGCYSCGVLNDSKLCHSPLVRSDIILESSPFYYQGEEQSADEDRQAVRFPGRTRAYRVTAGDDLRKLEELGNSGLQQNTVALDVVIVGYAKMLTSLRRRPFLSLKVK